jgi:mRNA interferase MazF
MRRLFQTPGHQAVTQIMTDKPVTIRRERIGRHIGRLTAADMARVNVALAFVLGLID